MFLVNVVQTYELAVKFHAVFTDSEFRYVFSMLFVLVLLQNSRSGKMALKTKKVCE